MSIEIGKQYIGKDGEVVKVFSLDLYRYANNGVSYNISDVVIFASSDNFCDAKILTERDFLEQYKPYEPVYEYRWVVGEVCSERVTKHYTDEEAKKELSCYLSNKQRIEYTKRERK